MNHTDPELLEAARFYAPNAENLQRAFVFGYLNGQPAPGMSLWERDAAEIGRRRAVLAVDAMTEKQVDAHLAAQGVDVAKLNERITERKTRFAALIIHGKNCAKVPHDPRGAYMHSADDDRPYDVDGVSYCGRCHFAR